MTVICSIKAQVFTVKEFEKLCSASQSDFDAYVLQKGYTLTQESEADHSRYYHHEPQTIEVDNIVRTPSPNALPVIMQQTENSVYYANVKASLAKYGYKEVKTKYLTVDGKSVPTYLYSNGQFTIVFSAIKKSINTRGEAPLYMQVHRDFTQYAIQIYKGVS
ncbi:MAG: hypothetical protein JWO06_1653 [Bacteroidota bacterium]|nr:hypothetical protein [Bacteroidota bacterium]